MCGLAKRLELVKEGENEVDRVGASVAVGVLSSFPGCAHSLAQRISNDIENNWRILSQQLYSMSLLFM